jgi:hypothetical protein
MKAFVIVFVGLYGKELLWALVCIGNISLGEDDFVIRLFELEKFLLFVFLFSGRVISAKLTAKAAPVPKKLRRRKAWAEGNRK